MPSANWLVIVSIIVSAITTLAAPIVALFVAARMNQPKPIPDPKNPKKRTHKMGGWPIRVLTSPWVLPLFGFLFNICILPYEIHHANPVTGKAAFEIALVVAGIFYNLALIYLSSLHRLIEKIIENDGRRNETIGRIVDIEGQLINKVKQLDEWAKTRETM